MRRVRKERKPRDRRPNVNLTVTDENEMIMLYEQGNSVHVIGEMYGVYGSRVGQILAKRGIPKRRQGPVSILEINLKEMARLRGEGLRYSEIGRRLGLSRQAVHYYLNKADGVKELSDYQRESA